MIHTGSNRMISLEPFTKNRDLDKKSCERDSRATTQSTNYYDLLDAKFHRARIEFCR